MLKVDNAITAAIKRAMEDARKTAIAKEKISNANTNSNTKALSPRTVKTKTEKAPVSILLNPENATVNANFIKNRGSLPWPVDKGYLLMHYGRNQLPSGSVMDITGITVATDIGSPVKSIFDGIVSRVVYIDDMQVIIIQHGKYFSTYSNLGSVSVQTGQTVKTGQVIGKASANLDGVGAVDFYINDERGNLDPEKWLHAR